MLNSRNLIILVALIVVFLLGGVILFTSFNDTDSSADFSADSDGDVKWYTDLNSAISEAQKTNKPIFAVFSASWCPACQQLESDTLTNPQVKQKLAQGYVAVKIDSDSNPELSSQYEVYGLPTIIIMDSEGAEIKKLIGYQSPDQLLSSI